MTITKIQIRNNSFSVEGKPTTVKQIELFIGGLMFSKDVQSEGDIKQAEMIAKDNGQQLYRLDTERQQPPQMRQRTWSNQHKGSLDDLDLTFLNLHGENKDVVSWFDASWKNEPCPRFTRINGRKNALLIIMDYQDVLKRENKVEDRFSLWELLRTDDGTTDEYEIDDGQIDQEFLYSGSDLNELQRLIKVHSK